MKKIFIARMKYIYPVFSVVLLCSFEPENWRHIQIGNSDGLSNSAVTSVFMDSEGFMWFGTWDGLNRYDGSNIRVFKPDVFREGSISNNIIRDILEDKNDNLWIVTEDGINRFNKQNERFTAFLRNNSMVTYRENNIRATLDADSVLWCSKFGKGIFRYNNQKQCFEEPINAKNYYTIFKRLLGFSFTPDNKLWTINEEGIVIALQKNNEWEITTKYNLSDQFNIDPDKNWFINHKGTTWLILALKNGGALVYNLNLGTPVTIYPGYTNFNITALSKKTEHDYVRGGTDEGVLFQLQLAPEVKIHFAENQLTGLSEKQLKIWSVTETSPDLLWIGTDGDGIYKYIMKNNLFVSTRKGALSERKINHNIVRAIFEDKKGNIWIGTRGNGLNLIPTGKGSTKVYDTKSGLSNNAVLSLGTDKYENILIGTDGPGIDMLETSTGKILHFPENFINHQALEFGSIYAICLDAFGDIWLGTSGYGLLRLSIKKVTEGEYYLTDYEQFRHNPADTNSFRSNVVYAIAEGEPNILWIGARGAGLYRLNTLTKKLQYFQSEANNHNSLNNNDVLSLWNSNDQALWVGTSGGLNRLDFSTHPVRFSHYTEYDGIPNNTIHAILGDNQGNIWMSTNKGLAKLNPDNGEISSYFYSDGLQSNEYTDGASFYSKSSGLFYFGGVNGFDQFDPEKIENSDYFPPLVITRFIINSQSGTNTNSFNPVEFSDSLVLKYNQNFFRIYFTTLNYRNKQKCRYAYKLDNFNRDYIMVNGEGEAIFTNVPPGEYTFRVKYTNEDRVWNPIERQMHITILPPFWKTSWAYSIYVFLIIASLFIAIKIILYRNHVKNKIKLERLHLQKTKEIQQYKFQFFTNIAHEFRTPLTLIMAPAAQLMDLEKDNKIIAPYLKSIYNNATRLLHLINELIDFRKVETGNRKLKVKKGNLSYLVLIITNAFLQYARQNKINLRYHNPKQEIIGWFDNGVIEKILLNLISNAIKYTPEQGSVSISTIEEKETVKIEVTDTGVGISKEYQKKIFDRFFHLSGSLPNQKGNPDSAGVGLSLTKSLVELHKGTILLRSEPGKGSYFTVTIPLNAGSYTPDEKHQEMVIDEIRIREKADEELIRQDMKPFRPNIPASTLESTLRDTILVVDDNPQLRNLIEDILQEYTVLHAPDGLEALETLKKHDIDLVISDILMPEVDGLELCKEIKNNIHTCHLPVILLTAKGDLEHRIEGIESGADSYIPKPFDPRHLKVRVKKLLENRRNIQNALREHPLNHFHKVKGLNNRDIQFLQQLRNFVEEHLDKADLDAGQIANHMAMSKTQLYRKVKAVTGFTPHGYLIHYRLNKATKLLLESSLTVSEIIFETGFNNRTYFYRCFKEKFGCSPGNYINMQQRNMKA